MGFEISVDRITKKFNKSVAIDGASILARKGISVIIGPNGAGKSTLLRCVGGLYRPESGTIRVFGKDPYSEDDVRSRVSLLSDNYALYDRLSVMKNLLFFGRLYGNSDADTMRISKDVLEKLNAYQYLDMKAEELSRGTKQKVAICRALLGSPDAFLLDEPTAFLDAVSAEKVHLMLEDLAASGKIILYATQRLNEATRFNANIFVIKRGRISDRLRYGELYGSLLRGATVNIKLADPIDSRLAARVPHFTNMRGSTVRITIRGYKDINESTRYLIGRGAYVVSIDYSEPLMEEMLTD